MTVEEMGAYVRNKDTKAEAYTDYTLNNRRRLLNVHTMVFYKPLLDASVYENQDVLDTSKGSLTKIAAGDIPETGIDGVFEKITWTEAEMLSPNENVDVLEGDKATYTAAVTTAETGRAAKYQAVDTQQAAYDALVKSIVDYKAENARYTKNKTEAQSELDTKIAGLAGAQLEASGAFIVAEQDLVSKRKLFFDYDTSGNCIGHKGMAPVGEGGSDGDGN